MTTLSISQSLWTISCNKSRTSVVLENQHSAVDMARALEVDVTVILVSYMCNVCFSYPCFELCIQHGLLTKNSANHKEIVCQPNRQTNEMLLEVVYFKRFPVFTEVVLFDVPHHFHVKDVLLFTSTDIIALCFKITSPSLFSFFAVLDNVLAHQ